MTFDTSRAKGIAKKLGFKDDKAQGQAAEIMQKLYTLFKETDATQVEINPLSETAEGVMWWVEAWLCFNNVCSLGIGMPSMDAKLGFDENAEFRQKKVFGMRDVSQEDAAEVEAAEYGLNFIKLDGNIGCLVNGAGLAMATMDVLKLNGGNPANFLDVGGSATAEAVKKAFELLLKEKTVKSIFVNIFGGIMRCDVIAEWVVSLSAESLCRPRAEAILMRAFFRGIIKATQDLQMEIPLIVRLQGTKEQEAKKLIKESGMAIFPFDGLDEAAAKAVEASRA